MDRLAAFILVAVVGMGPLLAGKPCVTLMAGCDTLSGLNEPSVQGNAAIACPMCTAPGQPVSFAQTHSDGRAEPTESEPTESEPPESEPSESEPTEPEHSCGCKTPAPVRVLACVEFGRPDLKPVARVENAHWAPPSRPLDIDTPPPMHVSRIG